MDFDNYGEVINGESTYKGIAEELGRSAVLIGWTDHNGTHLNILFTLTALTYGDLHGGVNRRDLFVSIMRWGAFGFNTEEMDTHPGYYDEKLGGTRTFGPIAEPLAELINGVKKYLNGNSR